MKRTVLKAIKRALGTKGELKELREKGFIPAVLYGKGLKENILLSLKRSDIERFLNEFTWENTLIDLDIEGEKVLALMHALDNDPVKGYVKHIDFLQVMVDKPIRLEVPIVSKGEPVGVKKGGILEHITWELEVNCLPLNIPESIEVDVSSLDIGDAIHLKDIQLPEGVTTHEEGDLVLFIVEHPKELVEAPAEEAAAGAEPEVITKGKKPENE